MLKVRKSKRAIQFAWIFAIIVGALILFLAFYFVGQTISRQKFQETTVVTQAFDTVLMPFSFLGSLGAISSRVVELPQTSLIEFRCSVGNTDTSNIGSNSITITDIKNKKTTGLTRISYDKYIFSEKLELKKMQLVSVPIELPWRVADAIILFPLETYCFVNAPSSFDKFKDLNISVNFTEKISECPKKSTTVCFTNSRNRNSRCNITVHSDCGIGCYNYGHISKKGNAIYFLENTLFAAIVSDSEIYNCNMKRIMNRLAMQCEIYKEKANSLSCRTVNIELLNEMKNKVKNIGNIPTLNDLQNIYKQAIKINSANRNAECTLY